MRTDDLIRRLAADLPDAASIAERRPASFGLVATVALALTIPLSVALYGPLIDLQRADLLGLAFWAGTVAVAVWATHRLARPEPAPILTLFGPPAILLAATMIMAWLGRDGGVTVFRTDHILHCAEIVGLLALGPFLWLSFVMRRGAPASPRAAGAMIGLIAGAIAALAYTLNCPIEDALAALSAHTVSVLLVSAFGATIGPSLFRW
ncbi:MAG: NrsF family protein [Pseudomonadota bacterium]